VGAPTARACTIGIRQEFVPLSKATVDDFRWASAANRDYLTVNVPDPFPEGAVAFERTAVATTLPPTLEAQYSMRVAPPWTFRVHRVLRGDLPREVVVVGGVGDGGGDCSFLTPTYRTGARQRVVARPDPATGHLRGFTGYYAELLPDRATGFPWGRSCPCSPPGRRGPPPGGAPRWGRG
jgi:hypothetical protein